MALWKEQSNTRKDEPVDITPEKSLRAEEQAVAPVVTPVASANFAPRAEIAPVPRRSTEGAESVIGSELSIEGTISGNGNIRLAGRFTGDVTVDGTVTIETGARLAGGVKATTVAIAGELEGNVVEATRVDVLPSGVVMGDLKADTLALAAGARVRGHVECGWANTPGTGGKGAANVAGRIGTP